MIFTTIANIMGEVSDPLVFTFGKWGKRILCDGIPFNKYSVNRFPSHLENFLVSQ